MIVSYEMEQKLKSCYNIECLDMSNYTRDWYCRYCAAVFVILCVCVSDSQTSSDGDMSKVKIISDRVIVLFFIVKQCCCLQRFELTFSFYIKKKYIFGLRHC